MRALLLMLVSVPLLGMECEKWFARYADVTLPDYQGGTLRLKRSKTSHVPDETDLDHRHTADLLKEAFKTEPAPKTIVVMGGGSGYMGLALRRRFPDAKLIVTDISPDAVTAMRKNALRNKMPGIDTRESDLFSDVPEKADLVVFVPPRALFGEEYFEADKDPVLRELFNDGGRFDLGARVLAKFLNQLPAHLTSSGKALITTDARVHERVGERLESRVLKKSHWDPEHIEDGFYGILELKVAR